jgi:YD repeat-containing protein
VIAKAVGAKASDIFHTSFEDDSGVAGSSQTGERYLNQGTLTITTEDYLPDPALTIVMSYWYWENSKWNFSGEVQFSRNISNGSRLDEIRAYPKGAQMTTITYDTHHSQVKTVTDSNSRTTSFEYDEFDRLKRSRDIDGNILSESKYHYYSQE